MIALLLSLPQAMVVVFHDRRIIDRLARHGIAEVCCEVC